MSVQTQQVWTSSWQKSYFWWTTYGQILDMDRNWTVIGQTLDKDWISCPRFVQDLSDHTMNRSTGKTSAASAAVMVTTHLPLFTTAPGANVTGSALPCLRTPRLDHVGHGIRYKLKNLLLRSKYLGDRKGLHTLVREYFKGGDIALPQICLQTSWLAAQVAGDMQNERVRR